MRGHVSCFFWYDSAGTVKEIEWVTDKRTGKFYGSAFLEFEEAESAEKALQKNGESVIALSRTYLRTLSHARGTIFLQYTASSPRCKTRHCMRSSV